MLKLFTAHNSICTQKVFLTLIEKGLDWESEYVDLFTNEQYRPEYLKLNPKGVVPTLIHEGHAIIESSLICEYLDETFPDPPLTPKTAHERARMRLWSKHIDEGVFEATREMSFSAMFRERMRDMTEEQRNGRFNNIGDPGRRARMVSTYNEGADSAYVGYGVFSYERMFRELDQALAEGGDWIIGNQFTLADINVMPFAARVEYLNLLDIWIGDRPRVQDWWARAKARPSYAKAISDKVTPEQVATMNRSGSTIKDRVAQHRADVLRDQPVRVAAE